MKNVSKSIYLLLPLLVIYIFCNTKKNDKSAQNTYLNLNDSAKYVGINTCKTCHANVYETFKKTGMGQSFHYATKEKSAATFTSEDIVYDSLLNYYYKPYWQNDSFFIEEYRLQNNDTIHSRVEHVKYIIGSGQHTNSHIIDINGYLYQAPITYYTQDGKWDLAPGFENGQNTRFTRLIGNECITCHNGLPDFEKGSENKFHKVLTGIDCERCHGPGSLHVAEKLKGNIIDTSKYIDPTIVNPADLSLDLQMSLCQRCHLQGIAVLQDNKSYEDFQPGMQLSSIMEIFLPKYKNDNQFIMASQADRLRQSQCFKQSKTISCITCHNPHHSVKEASKDFFNNTCKGCHSSNNVVCAEDLSTRNTSNNDNCFGCHMPKSGSIDIPHVAITDHNIKIPKAENNTKKLKEFVRLACMTNNNPSNLMRAKGYIAFYEKFSSNEAFLDSAEKFLQLANPKEISFPLTKIHLFFLQNKYQKLIQYIANINPKATFDGWTNYRIGEAFYKSGKFPEALVYYQKAVQQKPYNLEFLNKLGSVHLKQRQFQNAKTTFEKLISENPKHFVALSNLGFTYLNLGEQSKALYYYNKSLDINPDYEQAQLNKVGIHIVNKEIDLARQLLLNIIRTSNSNQAKQILTQLNTYYQ